MKEIVLILLLIVVVVLVYKFWKPFLRSPKREVPKDEARLYFFYTNWCGWSKKTMPEWEALEQQLQSTPYFGHTKITPVRVDAETDKKTAMLYEVEGYPTIILETSDKLYDYSGKRTSEDLLAFLRETFGKETATL
jgi:thiol-disulfide isomerase/thioredoxin